MNLSHYPSTSDNLNLMATQQSRSTTNDGDDEWQAQHPIQAYPDIDTYPAQQQQPINWGVRSGTAMNSAIIWDFLMAQVRVQLRNMSPDECFSRAVELHMLARSEVGMRREHLFNDTTEPVAIGQQSIVQSTASETGARSHYHYQPFAAAAATTISSFVSISPMRVHANNTSNINNITYPTQQQFHFGERQIMTSPMSNPYTMTHGMTYPQASPLQYQYQAEDVSSTPGYMRDRFLLAADIHPTAQQLHFNECQVLPSSPMASPIPNQFHKDEGMPPLPTSSAKDAETPNLFEETTPDQVTPNMQDDSVLDMNTDHLVQDDMPASSKGNPSSKKTKVASKWSEVPFKAKKTQSKPPKRRSSTRKKKLVSYGDSQASKSKMDTAKAMKKVVSKPEPPKQTKKKILTGTRIISPSDKDVICGRGGHSNNHLGNVRFRDEARQMRGVYQEASKFGKQESRASKRAISMVSNS